MPKTGYNENEQTTLPENSLKATKPQLTIAQSILTGSVAGATEVLINHPLWSIKTRLQSGDAFTLNPKVLYRGIFPNVASMIPITALQVGLNRCFQNLFFYSAHDLSSREKLASAFVAGVGSSFVSCPTEMIMTNQRLDGASFYAAGKRLFNQGGMRHIYSGLAATALREGLFTTFFLGITPALKIQITPYCPNDYAASLLAGVSAGIGATFASQGVDTIKTIQQTAKESGSLYQSIKKLYASGGIYGFFKGSIPRGARVISAVTLMGMVNEKMEQALGQRTEENTSTPFPK